MTSTIAAPMRPAARFALFRPPASTTVGYLARRFGDKQLAGLENAVGILARRSFEVLAEGARSRLLACRPSIDLDPTDVEVYGRKKRGFAFNCAGQLTGRPHPAIFAEAGLVLAGDLGSGTNDCRPQAPSLIARAIAHYHLGSWRRSCGPTPASSTPRSLWQRFTPARTSG